MCVCVCVCVRCVCVCVCVQVSRYYRAPEIILGNERGQPLDVWSIGCCLYEMHTGEILFRRNKDNNGLLYEIMKVSFWV